MNDLLFYGIIIALLYYFFIYLPRPKQLPTTKFENKEIQTNLTTEELTKLEKDLQEKKEEVAWLINQEEEIRNQLFIFQDQITELAIDKDSNQDLIQELEQKKQELAKDYQQLQDQLINLESERNSLQTQLNIATKTKEQLAEELQKERGWWDKWLRDEETYFNKEQNLPKFINNKLGTTSTISFNLEFGNLCLNYGGDIEESKKVIKCISEYYKGLRERRSLFGFSGSLWGLMR